MRRARERFLREFIEELTELLETYQHRYNTNYNYKVKVGDDEVVKVEMQIVFRR